MTNEEWTLCGVPVVERAKAEVLADIAAGRVPAGVADFASLHDHVDANYYGGAFESWEEGSPADDAFVAFWNRVQEEVDLWLRAGRPS